MLNNKSQGFITLFFGIIAIIAIIFFAIFILKRVQNVEEIMLNDTLSPNSNSSNEDFGESMKGSTQAEKIKKIKDPNIAPPELAG